MRADDPPAVDPPCPRLQAIRALLLVLTPSTVALAPLGTYGEVVALPWLIVAGVAGVLGACALFEVAARRRWARGLATLALGIWGLGWLGELRGDPGAGLLLLSAAVVTFGFLWPHERLRLATRRQRAAAASSERDSDGDSGLVLSGGVAIVLGWLARSPEVVDGPTACALAVAYAVPAVLGLRAFRAWGIRIAHLVALGAAGLPLAAWLGSPTSAALLLPYGPVLALGVALWVQGRERLRSVSAADDPQRAPGLFEAVMAHPSRVLVLSFMALAALGSFLLTLPAATASGVGLSPLDAVFTAVSATCVTGLIVVDTPIVFGGLGQGIILALIQLGGLGIMVFSAAALLLLGKRLSLSHERAAVDLVGAAGRAGLRQTIRAVLLVTLCVETIAALLLFAGFLAHGDPLGVAVWRGLFTAISAFCNAGFALQSESLVPYAEDPWILGVTGLTIVLGGLGPAVVVALLHWRQVARRSLHARVVVWATVIAIAVPALLIALLEWDRTLAGLAVDDKLVNAWFQSVTLRTAGFNSIDLTAVHPATWTVMVLMMFVGGSPGSTAGGAKTTTIAVTILALLAVIRGRQRIELFGRMLPEATVVRATAVTTLGVLTCVVMLAALQLTQALPLDVALFEIVSALATVGLSTGATSALDEAGKIIIIVCMFAGRVGPLTFFIFLTAQTVKTWPHRFPEEAIPIG